jgi:16S rRNA (cytosine1402-N4)-methyltransferase
LDQDSVAISSAKAKVSVSNSKCRVILVKSNFIKLEKVLADHHIKNVNGILFDLGVSSPQFDQAERGFSYQHEAWLDMRMDRSQKLTAHDIVNSWPVAELEKILRFYGEERFARQIAIKIVSSRERSAINTTLELVQVIRNALTARVKRKVGHPARRTFQALRIAVNDELGALEKGLHVALKVLCKGGRLVIITFHPLEDRICKLLFKQASLSCVCPLEQPFCSCKGKPMLKLITRKPIVPSSTEVAGNRRARSAKMRIVEKVSDILNFGGCI